MKLTPYITVQNAAQAIDFYCRAFGARETGARFTEPDGRIGHAEISFGDFALMLSDEYPEFGAVSPTTLGGSPLLLHLYVDDVDETVAKAEALGARVLRPPADQAYGDRAATIQDPFGHRWMISTTIERMDKETLQQRVGDAYRID
ncbi:MAG TPA: VOC family protein [Pseudomonadales bacterium]